MGILDLPHVDRIRTPGFVEKIDEVLENKCSCGGFTTSGVTWRMWLIYTFQMLFLFLAVVIGANIQVGMQLGPTFDAVDILRLVGGIPGILAGILGGIGVYIRMRYLLMGSVILNGIAIVFVFLSWAIDASDVSALNALTGQTVPVGQTPPNYGPPISKATTASIFGALGWIFTIIAFYLTYARYQEIVDPSFANNNNNNKSKQMTPQDTPLPEVAIAMPSNPQFTQPVKKNISPPNSKPVGSKKDNPKPKQAASNVHNCPQCEAEWPIDVKFCGECGSKIPDIVPEPQPQNPSTSTETWEEHFTEDGYMYYYNPKTGESKWAEA